MSSQKILIITGIFFTLLSCQEGKESNDGGSISLDRIHSEIKQVLENQILAAWYPRTVDSLHGGFLSDFDSAWHIAGDQNKMIVSQARQVWTCSRAYEHYPEKKIYLSMARQGFEFLRDVMWDTAYGGFYNLVSREGLPLPLPGAGGWQKQAYGNAFAIYGLAAYYRVSRDEEALNLAKKTFQWLEDYSHDPQYGGYFQFLQRDGSPLMAGFAGTPPKDQNSSIHLLEAFTELYPLWPDPGLRERLSEMLLIIRDTLVGGKNYLTLFCDRQWTPLSYRDSSKAVRESHYHLDEVSFGHDIETVYLLREAAEALEGTVDPPTEKVTRRMAEHALEQGFDAAIGGMYDAGYYEQVGGPLKIVRDSKNWWAQAETLNTLLILAQRYPDDPHHYLKLFKMQWEYIDQYLVDHQFGGWYNYGLDKSPRSREQHKAHIWKTPYHTARALFNVSNRLEEMHSGR
ncbi:MAG: AGE family epimerase/isomerase [Saprospiraceae bacterium]